MFKRVIFLGSVLGLGICFNGSYCSEAKFKDQLEFWQASRAVFCTHTVDTAGNCRACLKKIPRHEIRGHYFENHTTRTCFRCDSEIKTFKGFMRHINRCGQQRPGNLRPPRIFLNQSDLEAYCIEIESSQGSSVCKYCSKSCRDKWHLIGHVRAHHDESKRMICDLCGHQFVAKANLGRHRGGKVCNMIRACNAREKES